MVKPSDRSKKKKFVRTPKGKSKRIVKDKKHGKLKCALCKKQLHGVMHGKTSSERKKGPKTRKRPSVVFGGVLCSECRTKVLEETIKLKENLKTINSIELRLKPFVKQIERRIE